MNKNIMRAAGFGAQVNLVELGKCPFCRKPIIQTDFRNEISLREFKISGLCQKRQDDVFGAD